MPDPSGGFRFVEPVFNKDEHPPHRGSGFLSGTIARRAVAEGHRVWAVTRGKRNLPARAESIIADRTDRIGFAKAIADANTKWDLAVDCIAFTGDDAQQDLSALAGVVGHLVLVSTAFVVSPIDRPWRVDETYSRFDDSPYGRGKRDAEKVLLASSAPPFTILRPGHIYGPGSLLGCLPTHGRDPQLLDRLRRGEPLRLVIRTFVRTCECHAPNGKRNIRGRIISRRSCL